MIVGKASEKDPTYEKEVKLLGLLLTASVTGSRLSLLQQSQLQRQLSLEQQQSIISI